MTDTPATAFTPEAALRPPRNQWRDVWDQFRTHKGAMVGAAVFVFIVGGVIIGPWLWPLDATYIDIRARNQGMSLAHPFGTDQLGRDMLARMMAGGRVSVAVGLTAMALQFLVLEHVAQKWEPVLRFSDMRNQKVGVGRVNADERDPLWSTSISR